MMEVKAKLKNLNIGLNFCEFVKDLPSRKEKIGSLKDEFCQICPLEVMGD